MYFFETGGHHLEDNTFQLSMLQGKQKKRPYVDQAATNKRVKEAEVCSICNKQITNRSDKEAGKNAV